MQIINRFFIYKRKISVKATVDLLVREQVNRVQSVKL